MLNVIGMSSQFTLFGMFCQNEGSSRWCLVGTTLKKRPKLRMGGPELGCLACE
jgi:hypothetical protein